MMEFVLLEHRVGDGGGRASGGDMAKAIPLNGFRNSTRVLS